MICLGSEISSQVGVGVVAVSASQRLKMLRPVALTGTYAYDPHFDYLTGVSYNDGLANSNQNWTYDAAGNRISDTAQPGTWSYDNLNRMTASPGATYVHDVVGNRTRRTSGGTTTDYGWDTVNRMTAHAATAGTNGFSYKYRADGMRVYKRSGVTSMGNGTFAETLAGFTEHRTYYDGQMPLEESVPTSGNTTLTQNFIGARGLEAMTTKVGNSTPITSYPLYDVHGNMVATVQKGSSGTSWTIHDERSNDVWGSVRSGIATGGPRGRYCANLGHVQDDESGLVYMRARYYEPGSGQFISEDPAYDGANWYTYCGGDPVNLGDSNGRTAGWAYAAFVAGMGFALLAATMLSNAETMFELKGFSPEGIDMVGYNCVIVGGAGMVAAALFSIASLGASGTVMSQTVLTIVGITVTAYAGIIMMMTATTRDGVRSLRSAKISRVATYTYGLILLAELIAMDVQAAMN